MGNDGATEGVIVMFLSVGSVSPSSPHLFLIGADIQCLSLDVALGLRVGKWLQEKRQLTDPLVADTLGNTTFRSSAALPSTL